MKKKIADETREGGDDSDETRLQTPREKITWQTKEDKGMMIDDCIYEDAKLQTMWKIQGLIVVRTLLLCGKMTFRAVRSCGQTHGQLR